MQSLSTAIAAVTNENLPKLFPQRTDFSGRTTKRLRLNLNPERTSLPPTHPDLRKDNYKQVNRSMMEEGSTRFNLMYRSKTDIVALPAVEGREIQPYSKVKGKNLISSSLV